MAVGVRIRRLVDGRAGGRCEYCRCPAAFSSSNYAVEHIHPRDLGGTDDPENLAWSCQGCNDYKAAVTEATDSATGEAAPLYHPRRQAWGEHFVWSSDWLTVLGRTPVGRATIERLRLNRPSVINLRRALIAVGEHPPAGRA